MASNTRFPRALAAIFLLSLPACGDSTSTTTATTAATTDSSGPATATETTSDTTTTTTATTDNPTSTGTMGQTTTTTATTAPETTTGTTTTGVSATTTETTETTSPATTETSGETTEGTTDTSTSETGEPVGSTCEQDSDCQVFTDCCTCDVLAVGEQPPACNVPECFVEACAVLDVGSPATPVCRFGRCTFEKVTCNPIGVTCKVLPPDCPVGQIPSVKGDCWSGQCTPVEACDWVPDCAACTTDPTDPLVCVFKAQKGAYHVCEPKPVDCGDMADIDCGCGQEICDASPPHTECHDATPGIVCECPVC